MQQEHIFLCALCSHRQQGSSFLGPWSSDPSDRYPHSPSCRMRKLYSTSALPYSVLSSPPDGWARMNRGLLASNQAMRIVALFHFPRAHLGLCGILVIPPTVEVERPHIHDSGLAVRRSALLRRAVSASAPQDGRAPGIIIACCAGRVAKSATDIHTPGTPPSHVTGVHWWFSR